jgi:hypothetical protein
MPIDDLLAELEGVPDHMLKEPLKIPKTIKDLQEIYPDYKISKYAYGTNTLSIISTETNKNNTDYVIDLKGDEEKLHERNRCVFLIDKGESVYQAIKYNIDSDFWQYIYEYKTYNSDEVPKDIKEYLEKWLEETDESILKEIPELEEFVKQYAN